MSRWVIENVDGYADVIVGCDEGLGAPGTYGALFLQCFRPGDDEASVWYPRLENLRELELVARGLGVPLSEAMRRQLRAELQGKPPLLFSGDRVWVRRQEGPQCQALVLQPFYGGRAALIRADSGEERWESMSRLEFDPYGAPPDDAELERLEHHCGQGHAGHDWNDAVVVHGPLSAAEDALYARLLRTGGLFERSRAPRHGDNHSLLEFLLALKD